MSKKVNECHLKHLIFSRWQQCFDKLRAPPVINPSKKQHTKSSKMARDVGSFLSEQQRKATGDVAQEWNTMEELYNKK